MKPLNTYILENYISNIFESFNEPKLSECSFLETVENNDYNYNLYVTPHGHKRSHRSLDTFDSISNDYTNNDIKRITRKCYEQIINKFEDPNTSLTIGTAYSCIWVQTKNIIKDGKKLNLLYKKQKI